MLKKGPAVRKLLTYRSCKTLGRSGMPDSPVFNCEKCECGNILLLKERTECVYTIIGTGKNPPLFQHALPDDGRSAIFSEWSFFLLFSL